MSTTSSRPPNPGDLRTPSKGPGTDNRRGGRPALLLVALLGTQFMALLDTFIVSTALPTMRADLDASGAGLQLVAAGYTIAYAVFLVTGARLGALIGHRRVWIGGLALFTAASLACGLAADTGQLIGFRLVQGAGAALLIPQVLSLIQRNFTGEARARVLGAYSAVLALGAVSGLVVGGVLVGADLFGLAWRPAFLVNVPIGAVLLLLGLRVLPHDRGDRSARGLDLPGLVLLGAAVCLLTVPLVLGHETGWPTWTWVGLTASAVVFGAFLAYESRLARRGGAPLVSPRVLRIPGMGRAAFGIAVAMAVNAGFVFAAALHVQDGLGYGALHAGLLFAPTALAFGLAGLTWQRWPARLQAVLVPAGFALAGLSTAVCGLLWREGGDGGLLLLPALVCLGAGLSCAFSPVLAGALATVRLEDAPDASGLLVTVTQLGQVLGVSAFGTLFLSQRTTTGAAGSADGWWWCSLALAFVSLLGAAAHLVRARR
ncbi:MFS transporter [Streptomyces sp. NPDC017979]|uniref:MFS transporter n=1 Tax=Streptomyces sp. NPDC017979 TaxID=3365024 RepID=UPI00378CBCDD